MTYRRDDDFPFGEWIELDQIYEIGKRKMLSGEKEQ